MHSGRRNNRLRKKQNPCLQPTAKKRPTKKKDLIQIRSKEIPATYVVFDILSKNSKDLTSLPLIERRKILHQTIKQNKQIEKIKSSQNGKELWKQITKKNMEGLIAKEKNSKYHKGKRRKDWLKIKSLKTMDCIIIGYTQEKRNISALALAVYHKNKLKYIGKVGTGFTEKLLKELYPKLQKLETKKNPTEYKRKIQ